MRERVFLYQTPMACCIKIETREMAAQQQNPINIGLPPFFTNFTISEFRPIAAIAMIIKNLEQLFKKPNAASAAPMTAAFSAKNTLTSVVTADARIKYRMNMGKTFFRLKLFFASVFSFFIR